MSQYNSKVYTKQGGSELVIDAGAKLTVTAASGADSAGYISARSVQLVKTSTGTIPAFGYATIAASSTSPDYTIDAPLAGAAVHVTCAALTGSGDATVTSTADFASGKNRLKFDAVGEHVILIGTSTGGWHVHNFSAVATTSG